MAFEPIFQPLNIRHLTLRNRVVVPPMLQLRPITSPEGIAWYRRMAAGGAGLVIVEGTGVSRFGTELTSEELLPLTEAIHANGAAAAIQLAPPKLPPETGPDQITPSELRDLIESYARAAEICHRAGFDGVEPHGAHGFLLNQFFMPSRNHRTDGYGTTPEGRSRTAVEIVQAIRRQLGDAVVILYRHTPQHQDYGVSESVAFARRLVDAGVDVLDISPARDKAIADLAAPFHELGVPVIAVNGMEDPAAATEALTTGRCDLIAIGRQLICDAQWPEKVRTHHLEQIVPCEKCDKGCYGALREHRPPACLHWDRDAIQAYTGPSVGEI